MNKKIDYLDNYKTNTLYINDSHQDGKYLTVVNGKILVECEISPQIKLAIKAFYANQKNDITHYEIIKFKLLFPLLMIKSSKSLVFLMQ